MSIAHTTNQPTQEELQQAVDVLARLPRGFLPKQVFLEVARLVTTPTIEVAPLRENADGTIEILLTKRPADDPHWANMWHITGTILLSTDEEGDGFTSGVERVLRGELQGVIPILDGVHYVSTKFWDVARGRELDQIFYFKTNVADEAVREGRFFNVEHLPESVIDHHKIMISEIVQKFRKNRSHG